MCASSKNNCIKNNLFQIQKTLVNIPIQAYNFKLKRIPSSFKHFYAEKQYVMFIILGYQAVTIMNHCYYYFDDPWKVKALYVIIMHVRILE